MNLTELTIHQLHTKLLAREMTSVELTRAFLARIAATDPQVNAFITVCESESLAAAADADARIAAGQADLLTGIPLALKDIFCTAEIRTTCASKILDNFVAPYDGTAVAQLKERGAVILGKLNMDEFAMGSSNENSAFGPVKNPWNLETVPGGSSGGSAAAVAARQAAGALGTDTGGSIRQPASHCGVVGLKPTYGRVSRYGVIAYASSLDQVGPLARDVEDCAILLQAIAGHDPADSTSVDTPVPNYRTTLRDGVKGLRIGLPKEYFIEGLDPEVKAAVDAAIAQYRQLGAEIVEVSLPHTDYAVACYYLIATAEASSNLARYDGVRFGTRVEEGKGLLEMYMKSRAAGFGAEVKRRIMLGTYALSSGYYDAYYGKAQRVRTMIIRDFDAAYERFDVLLSPTSPCVAFPLGDKTTDPMTMYLNDVCTIPSSLAGHPAMSVPFGTGADDLPVGIQVMAPALGEEPMFRVAAALEAAAPEGAR